MTLALETRRALNTNYVISNLQETEPSMNKTALEIVLNTETLAGYMETAQICYRHAESSPF